MYFLKQSSCRKNIFSCMTHFATYIFFPHPFTWRTQKYLNWGKGRAVTMYFFYCFDTKDAVRIFKARYKNTCKEQPPKP